MPNQNKCVKHQESPGWIFSPQPFFLRQLGKVTAISKRDNWAGSFSESDGQTLTAWYFKSESNMQHFTIGFLFNKLWICITSKRKFSFTVYGTEVSPYPRSLHQATHTKCNAHCYVLCYLMQFNWVVLRILIQKEPVFSVSIILKHQIKLFWYCLCSKKRRTEWKNENKELINRTTY